MGFEEETGLQAAYDYQLQNEEGEPIEAVTIEESIKSKM
jgi:hypothetical protein